MDVSIIIVNYNTADIIEDCLQSIKTQQEIEYEIIVVDNASQDESLAVLKLHTDWIHLIASPENLGFGRANNLAFKKAKGEYIFLLNPDACFTKENDLARMLAFMKSHSQYGAAGTRIAHLDGSQQTSPRLNYPGQKHLNQALGNLPGEIAWVVGASLIVRRDVYEKTGGFDEDFFLYGEETDWCLRIRKRGFAIGYFPEVTVKHMDGASERKTPPYEFWLKKQKGLHLFYQKNYHPEDVRYLLKRSKKQATFRLFLLKLKKRFLGLSAKQLGKFNRYQAILDLTSASN